MFAMEAGREISPKLMKILSQDRSTSDETMASVVTQQLQGVQRKCFVQAKKAIFELGEMRDKYPDVELNTMPDKRDIENKAHALYKLILDMKQCMAYTELASRYT